MTSSASPSGRSAPATTLELFTPKLITVLREGYHLRDLRADVISGLTVAIVALPLSMAIAIASGATPERGLFTAIIGGFLICALSGSRFQIGGPAAAFIRHCGQRPSGASAESGCWHWGQVRVFCMNRVVHPLQKRAAKFVTGEIQDS